MLIFNDPCIKIYFLDPKCPSGWHFYKPTWKCYGFYIAKVTWSNARDTCRKISGGDLAAVTSYDLAMFLKNKGMTAKSWIGGWRSTNGNWYWSDGSGKVTYTRWYKGQPDNHGGHQHSMLTNFGEPTFWDDETDNDLNHYICQKKMPGTGAGPQN